MVEPTERPDPQLLAQRRRALLIDAVRWSCLVGGLAAGGAALLASPALGISIALGTLLAAINLVLLARGIAGALDGTVEAVERARREGRQTGTETGQIDPEAIVDRPRGVGGGLRLLLVVALVGAVFIYRPAQPIGLAIGVIVVLAGLSLAALREHQRTSQKAS